MFLYALGCFFLQLAGYSKMKANGSIGYNARYNRPLGLVADIVGIFYLVAIVYGFFIYPFWVPLITFICGGLVMSYQIITPLFTAIGTILLVGSIIIF